MPHSKLPSFSETASGLTRKLRRVRQLKDLFDHRKKRDKVWEQALAEYVDLILGISRDLKGA